MSTLFGKKSRSKKEKKKEKDKNRKIVGVGDGSSVVAATTGATVDDDDDDDDDDCVNGIESSTIGDVIGSNEPSNGDVDGMVMVAVPSEEVNSSSNKRPRPPPDDDDNDDDGDVVRRSMDINEHNEITTSHLMSSSPSSYMAFDDFNGLLAEPLIETCRALGYNKPTPVQQTIIPFLIHNRTSNVLALAATGTGKTASFVLPILHHLSVDPYGIYAVIVSPTRELASQIHQQVLALGSRYSVRSCLVIGGMGPTKQSTQLDAKPHIVVATPGRLAELLRGPSPPHLANVRYLVLDEADRLLSTEGSNSEYANSGFERDVAELIVHCNRNNNNNNKGRRKRFCQTLLFSATMTRSLESLQEIAGGVGERTTSASHATPLAKFVIRQQTNEDSIKVQNELDTDKIHDTPSDHDTSETKTLLPSLPAGLRQEYIFMPSRVRDAYLLATIRTLVVSNGRGRQQQSTTENVKRLQNHHHRRQKYNNNNNSRNGHDNDYDDDEDDDDTNNKKARSVIVFVSTCQRCALVSEILAQVGVENVALHSLLSQNRRLASLAKFKSHHVRVCVATDLASRGLDIPTVDLVINAELPRNPVSYVHRIGRTARAGRRGRAINLISENDVALVHAAESTTGKQMDKCKDVTDDIAIKLLGSVTKAARLAKIKLADIGFDELVKKATERKVAEKKERRRIERALKRQKR